MKKYIVFIICLIIINNLSSQTFEKFIKNPQDEIVYDALLIEEPYVIFAYNYGITDQEYDATIFKMNYYTGEIVDKLNLEFSNYNEYRFNPIYQILLYQDTSYIITCSVDNNNTGDAQLYLCHINTDLEITFDTIIGDLNKSDAFYDRILNSQNNIVLVGRETINEKTELSDIEQKNNPLINECSILNLDKKNPSKYPHTLLLSEISIWGKEINRYTFISYSEGHLACTIMEIPDQEHYHFYRFFDTQNHSFQVLNTHTLELENTLEYPVAFSPRMAIKGNTDSLYYTAGRQHILADSSFSWELSYLEINQYGDIINQHSYYTGEEIFYTLNTFAVNDESIIFAGEMPFVYNPPFFFYPEPRWILFFKLDLVGDVLWQKLYKGEVHYTPYKILATPDGGALIFSTRYDWNDPYPNQRDVHILKIDCNGNYVPAGMDKPKTNMKQILVYPNPTKDKISFNFGLYSRLTISIYNVQGTQVFSKSFSHSPTINIKDFSSGIYIYTISNDEGFFERGKIVVE